MQNHPWRALALVALLGAAGCKHGGYGVPGGGATVNLEPNDPRPVFSIQVGDEIEAALLEQQLGLAPLRLTGNTLYFFDSADIRTKLADYGYVATKSDPYVVYQRVVRVARRGEEEQLKRFALHVINREQNAWIVRGTIGALRSLQAAGYTLTPIASNEPRPRAIRIWARTPEEVQEISRHAAIYAVSGQYVSRENGRYIGVAATAFDDGIDELTAAGFKVELIEEPRPENSGVRP